MVPLMKQADAQLPWLQTSDGAQLTPSGPLDQATVLSAGWQIWHGFAGFTAPG